MDQDLRCKLCLNINSVRVMALELVDYSLRVEGGRICVDHADETNYETASKLGLYGTSTHYCDACKAILGGDDYEIVNVDHDTGLLVDGDYDAIRHSIVSAVVGQLIRAGILATHEWRDHIRFTLGEYDFHWGTTGPTWACDVTGRGGCPEVGSMVSLAPSDSKDAHLIFSAIYIRSTLFKGTGD